MNGSDNTDYLQDTRPRFSTASINYQKMRISIEPRVLAFSQNVIFPLSFDIDYLARIATALPEVSVVER